ncbi:MAG: SCO family protein [Candidatus Thiodiazotropha sp. (ex Monitilora ramsayi)]|nr:SCO family protein [Candidatus Thiodiazotropha sp. (ex Monitilora ramsayi)]
MKLTKDNGKRAAGLMALALTLGAGLAGAASQQHHDHSMHDHHAMQSQGVDPHAAHKAMLQKPSPVSVSAAQIKLPDLELLDQDGRKVNFRSDVIQDRLVVIDFIYTSCTTVCPILSSVFEQLQEDLGDALGQEVFLVSISVDPGTDRPARLKAYAESYSARPGWTFLTGGRQEIDQLLAALGTYAFELTEHPPSVLVGHAGKGTWTRFNGFPKPEEIHHALAESRS